MPRRVSGYMADQFTFQYITTGGRVLITGDAELETPLLSNGAFCFEDVPAGAFVVSIVDVEGYNPTNKLLDIAETDGDIELGWFKGNPIPKSMWGTHNDYEEAASVGGQSSDDAAAEAAEAAAEAAASEDTHESFSMREGLSNYDFAGGVKTFYKGLGFCGGGVNSNTCEVDVKDGRIVRTRPFRYDRCYTPEQMNAWTIKARGSEYKASMKSLIPPFSLVYKKRAYSTNRILYPLKRVDWDPNGERNTQNRGESKFERIGWDEAIDILVSEIRRIHKEYGPYSIYCQIDGHGETKVVHAAHGCQTNLLDLLGGYTYQARQPDSWEGWHWGAKHVWGQDPLGQADQYNLWMDVAQNSDMLMLWGCDMETTTWGWEGQQSSKLCYWFTELGIKQVYVCPDLNYGNQVHADKWIPILPNTDAALQLAIIYTWLAEGLWDKKYVEEHCYGYDVFFDYVLGKEDGVPKTPKWAEEKCGVPSRQIKALARTWHKKRTSIGHGNGGSFIRSIYSHEPARLEVLCMAMQAIGTPGRNVMKFIEWQMMGQKSAMPGPRSELIPYPGGAYKGWMMGLKPSSIPKTMLPQAITGGWTEENPMRWYSFPDASFPAEQQFLKYQYPVPGAKPIHMIWSDAPCWTTCWNGGNEAIEAYKHPSIEFIVTEHIWFENDCRYADLLLPVSTKFESADINCDTSSGDFNYILYEGQCIDAVGESKTDYEIACEVAKAFGPVIYEQFTKGLNIQDNIRIGFETSGCQDYLDWDEFFEKGYFVIPTAEGWEDDPRGHQPFAEDPIANPMRTPNGKINFYSDELAKHFPDDQERPPYPKWVESGINHPDERRGGERAKKYPFLIVSNHPRWRVHAELDDITWLREIETCKIIGPDGYRYEPVWINPSDAEDLGIKTGDIIKVFNDRGWVLGGAYVSERIIKGAVFQDHGARVDAIVSGVSDRGGANNLIAPLATTSKNAVGEVTSGFLVGVEKVDVFEMAKEYPEAFQRVFDDYGVLIDNWIV